MKFHNNGSKNNGEHTCCNDHHFIRNAINNSIPEKLNHHHEAGQDKLKKFSNHKLTPFIQNLYQNCNGKRNGDEGHTIRRKIWNQSKQEKSSFKHNSKQVTDHLIKADNKIYQSLENGSDRIKKLKQLIPPFKPIESGDH